MMIESYSFKGSQLVLIFLVSGSIPKVWYIIMHLFITIITQFFISCSGFWVYYIFKQYSINLKNKECAKYMLA